MKTEEPDKRLEAEFTGILKPLGFNKREKTWVRETAQCFCLVNLQKSRWGRQFYVNLGAFVKQLGSQVTAPQEQHCHFRVRLTNLLSDKAALERCLDFENEVAEEERLRTIGSALLHYGVEWLKSVETLEGIRERLVDQPQQGAAVTLSLKALLGIEEEGNP
jgi:hypothetical protein